MELSRVRVTSSYKIHKDIQIYFPSPGPRAWSSQHPQCGGQNQSPINLLTKKDRTVSDLLGVELNFTNYDLVSANNTELLNNGHTVELEVAYMREM